MKNATLLIVQRDWSDVAWFMIGLIFIGCIYLFYLKFKEDEKRENSLFLSPEEKKNIAKEQDQKRYNKFLDSIENHTPATRITVDEYRKAKETVSQYEKQES